MTDGSSDRWQLVFSLCLPRISGMPYPSGVKSQPNSGEGFTPRGKGQTESQARNSQRVKVSPDSGHKNPSGVKSQPNSGEGFTPWGKVPTESRARNSHRVKARPESQARFTPPGCDDLNAKTLIAYPVEIQTESSLPHCIPGKNVNRISGTILQPVQKSKRELGHGFAIPA